MDIFATIFAGLGLFFIGVKLIGSNLKQMTGRRFRMLVSGGTQSPVLAALIGTVSGALTQSSNAVTFIVVSMTSAGLVTIRRALPVLVWANVGTSALVLLATVDMHTFVLLVVGVTGILHFLDLDRSAHHRHFVGALLGAGLLFFGLQLIKDGAAPLRDLEMAREFVVFAADSFFIAFLIGLLLTLLTQSSATVSVIAVAMISVGLLDLDQTIMIVLGASVGSGISTWFMGANLVGTPRQLINLQLVNKTFGALVLVPLFLLELATGWPLVKALLGLFADSPAGQVAWAYLLIQVTSAALVSPVIGPLYRLLERMSPATEEEELARPRYLYEQALDEPETAVDLVEKEQARLLGYIRAALDHVRDDARDSGQVYYRSLHAAGSSLAGEIDAFLTDLLESSLSRSALEKAMRMESRNRIIIDLFDAADALVGVVDRGTISERLRPLAHSLVESFHIAVDILIEEMADPDPLQRQALLGMTGDRSEMMDRIRRQLLQSDSLLDKPEQDILFAATSLFERGIWLVRRFVMLLDAPAEGKVGAVSGQAG